MNMNIEIEKIVDDLNNMGFENKIGLSTKELAKVLGLSVPSIENFRRNAVGPIYSTFGKRICYTKRAVAEYIVLNQVKTL